MTENVVTLPLQKAVERNQAQDDKVTVDKNKKKRRLEEEKVNGMQPKESQSRSQISAPKWSKDYVIEDSEFMDV